MIKVKIRRFLRSDGGKPYYIDVLPHKLRSTESCYSGNFSTLTDLKTHFGIDKVLKTSEVEGACSSKGKVHQWIIYDAYIEESFIFTV